MSETHRNFNTQINECQTRMEQSPHMLFTLHVQGQADFIGEITSVFTPDSPIIAAFFLSCVALFKCVRHQIRILRPLKDQAKYYVFCFLFFPSPCILFCLLVESQLNKNHVPKKMTQEMPDNGKLEQEPNNIISVGGQSVMLSQLKSFENIIKFQFSQLLQ